MLKPWKSPSSIQKVQIWQLRYHIIQIVTIRIEWPICNFSIQCQSIVPKKDVKKIEKHQLMDIVWFDIEFSVPQLWEMYNRQWGKLNVIAGLLTRFTPPTIILLSTALSFSWSRMCSILQKKKNLKWIESVTKLAAFQILRWIIHALWLVLPWFFLIIYCRADTWITSPLTTLCL